MTRYNLEERFLHGGDYNPDQWLNYPEILAKDLELMEKAHANTSVSYTHLTLPTTPYV